MVVNFYNNEGICNIIAGIIYVGLAFVLSELFSKRLLKIKMENLGMPKFSIKAKWIIVAVLIPSVLFGLVHIIGMDFSIISSLLVLIAGTMVGIMFSMVAIESGSVWNSGIVHSLWNILIIGGGLSISEKADEYSVMTYVLDSKVFVFTGGEFGQLVEKKLSKGKSLEVIADELEEEPATIQRIIEEIQSEE